MRTYYVIRSGWNAANQSSLGASRNPKNDFESHWYSLVGIVEANSEQEAIEQVNATCYNNQAVFVVTNPRAIKGLTAEVNAWLEGAI